MAARDDSVIRGSLITSLILLVLSLALNFILWSWGDKQAEQESLKSQSLSQAQNEIRQMEEKALVYKAMLGIGQLTQSQYDSFENMDTDDDDYDQIAQSYHTNMKVFGQEVGMEDRNYSKLPEYFTTTIRSRNEETRTAVAQAAQIRAQAATDVQTAQQARAAAEKERDSLANELDDARVEHTQARNDMLQKMESAKDSKTKSERKLQEVQRAMGLERNQLVQRTKMLQNTIDTQKLELQKLRDGRFESVQGEIRYVIRGGSSGTQLVSVNLGSADELRPGITFGVIDKNDTDRLQDADVKASIQITSIRGPHLAEARVVAFPEIGNPIIEGDAVYSPFWAPGRSVRIALVGDIDVDGDGKPDNAMLEGKIAAAGAQVAARVTVAGVEGNLDPGIRFMVVPEAPELDGSDDAEAVPQIQVIGQAKQLATELGITVIPAWKLQGYLTTLSDSQTTPLGQAVRGSDFPPTTAFGKTRRRPVDLPKMYQQQRDNVQTTNEIVKP